jgi:hypothetical protein
MKAIVVVFMSNRNGDASADKTLVAHDKGGRPTPLAAERGARTVSRLALADKTPTPLWTWFIENPRTLRA